MYEPKYKVMVYAVGTNTPGCIGRFGGALEQEARDYAKSFKIKHGDRIEVIDTHSGKSILSRYFEPLTYVDITDKFNEA